MQQNTYSAFIAVIGPTNAGKSTLVNKIIGSKVSITSHKVQTTRHNILGVYTKENKQLVFIDTPGIFNPRRRLDRAMIKSAKNSTEDTEVNILLIDASNPDNKNNEKSLDMFKSLKQSSSKNILVLNKIDLVKDKTELINFLQKLEEVESFDKVFMISALKKHGFKELLSYLLDSTVSSPFLYPTTSKTGQSNYILSQEITREKIYKYCHKELPYNIMVKNSEYKEDEKSVTIHQTIYATKESYKKIILGSKGENIKKIGTDARLELTKLLGKKVNLFLFVKIKTNWLEDKEFYEDFGLDFNV